MHPQLYNLPGPDATNTPSTTIGPTNLTLYPAHCAHFGTPGHVSLPPPPQQQRLYVHISRQLIQHCQEDGNKFTTETKKAHLNVKRPPTCTCMCLKKGPEDDAHTGWFLNEPLSMRALYILPVPSVTSTLITIFFIWITTFFFFSDFFSFVGAAVILAFFRLLPSL